MSPLAVLASVTLVLAGCSGGDDKDKAQPPPKSPSAAPAAPPTYTVEHLDSALLKARDIGADVRESKVTLDQFKDRLVPMCSLTGVKLPGRPKTVVHQYADQAKRKYEARYGRLVAQFPDAKSATEAFELLQQKSRSCPAKRRVPPKKIRENFTLLAHDDTWKPSMDSIAGWSHIRGTERQVVSASQTKLNVYHLMYDYAVRGNVLLATLYYERADPKKSADPISRRATEILTKQLQKIG